MRKKIGDNWLTDLRTIKDLEKYVDDPAFREEWAEAKLENKHDLAKYINHTTGMLVDPHSMFDVQIKRIHEYKRQTLFAFYLVSRYIRIKNSPREDHVPRTAVIGGKAAPSYAMAKLTVKLINSIADVINSDPDMKGLLSVIFMENYNVSVAEKIFPASDLSEQISLAGREASGTGNMKFMLNGAVTIGTLDGANVEIAEEVGDDNIFIFGLKAHEVAELRAKGYCPKEYLERDPLLKEVFDLINNDFFSQFEPGVFKPLCDSLLWNDEYMVFADFPDYVAKQELAQKAYADRPGWIRKSMINAANSGKFSSDRTIREYASKIWGLEGYDNGPAKKGCVPDEG
jgi:starch phosphorylase